MNRLSTLPSLREQARHALLLLGVPAPARLVVDVHAAFFDGDLSVPALAALMREDERSLTDAEAERPPPDVAAERLPDDPVAKHSPADAIAERPLDDAAERSPRDATAERPPGDATPGSGERLALICPALHLDLAPARGIITLSIWPLSERLTTPALARAHALVATVRIAEFVAARAGASACARELLKRLAANVPGGPEALDLAEAARNSLNDPALAAAAAAEELDREVALTRAQALDESRRLFGVPSLPHQRGGA